MDSDGAGIPPEIQSFRDLFQQGREPTKRILVEFYESDWKTISKLKEELDLSWKDFFRAIALWFGAFQKNKSLMEQVAKFIGQPEAGSALSSSESRKTRRG